MLADEFEEEEEEEKFRKSGSLGRLALMRC
jgi:hypothetical protein